MGKPHLAQIIMGKQFFKEMMKILHLDKIPSNPLLGQQVYESGAQLDASVYLEFEYITYDRLQCYQPTFVPGLQAVAIGIYWRTPRLTFREFKRYKFYQHGDKKGP